MKYLFIALIVLSVWMHSGCTRNEEGYFLKIEFNKECLDAFISTRGHEIKKEPSPHFDVNFFSVRQHRNFSDKVYAKVVAKNKEEQVVLRMSKELDEGISTFWFPLRAQKIFVYIIVAVEGGGTAKYSLGSIEVDTDIAENGGIFLDEIFSPGRLTLVED